MTSTDQRLLTEQSRAGDLLQHRPLARALARSICDTPQTESLGIALFGAWGQGKSMIGKLLEECLLEATSGDFVFVRIDAWKYAHEGERQPLRRHYLLRAYEAAGLDEDAERLRSAFATKVVSEAIDERSRAIAFARDVWRRLRQNWRYLVPLLVALAALWAVRPAATTTVILSLIGAAAAILFATSAMLDAVIRILMSGLTITTEHDPFRSVEEFDHQFTQLLETDAADVDRFVFFIDDLDRCQDDLVVEAIETLQAFFGRARCAYIVAADERQLKRAVRAVASGPTELGVARSVIPTDETFLEKIFQVTVHVPPVYEETLADYARKVSADTAIADLNAEFQEDLIGYLVHAQVVSPRQVRVIINDFLVVFLEAREREFEDDTYLPGERLTSAPLFLAKMVVLRSHFPWFFNLLYPHPDLLLRWPQTLTLDPEDWNEDHHEADRLVRRAAAGSVRESSAFAEPVMEGPTNRDEEPDGSSRTRKSRTSELMH